MQTQREQVAKRAQKATLVGIAVNGSLALVKALAGYFGNSYALIADAVESFSDVLSSVIVLLGLRIAVSPPTKRYPYGRGRAETLAGLLVVAMLLAAAVGIAIQSVHEIKTPHHSPAPFTLFVLLFVIAVKEKLFRFAAKVGESTQSTAVRNDAWHHRSDALTSAAAFIGISIALVGGEGYEAADDWAALFVSVVIAVNAYILLIPTLRELIDLAPDSAIENQIRTTATAVDGVLGTHNCRVRKHGFDYYVELDILCSPDNTIRQGHDIAHAVGDAIQAELPMIRKVFVHVEPIDDFGRRG